MGKVINLTLLRNVDQSWRTLTTADPRGNTLLSNLETLRESEEFRDYLVRAIANQLNSDNVDLICYIIEKSFPGLAPLLREGKHIYYVQKRIDNCLKLISGETPEPYIFAFPMTQFKPTDSRANFLMSILNYIDYLGGDQQTIDDLLDTPIKQYEQMVHYIAFFPHEKIPILLERLSYVEKMDYARMTIPVMGNFKTKDSLSGLLRLSDYFAEKNPEIQKLVWLTLQKILYHQPEIH